MQYRSIFECGLDVNSNNQMTFNSRFFFFLLMFLVFDIELVLILQIPKKIQTTMIFWGLRLMLLFLVFTTLEEWRRGSFQWT